MYRLSAIAVSSVSACPISSASASGSRRSSVAKFSTRQRFHISSRVTDSPSSVSVAPW